MTRDEILGALREELRVLLESASAEELAEDEAAEIEGPQGPQEPEYFTDTGAACFRISIPRRRPTLCVELPFHRPLALTPVASSGPLSQAVCNAIAGNSTPWQTLSQDTIAWDAIEPELMQS